MQSFRIVETLRAGKSIRSRSLECGGASGVGQGAHSPWKHFQKKPYSEVLAKTKRFLAGSFERKQTKFERREMPVAVLAEVPADSAKFFEESLLTETKLEPQNFVFQDTFNHSAEEGPTVGFRMWMEKYRVVTYRYTPSVANLLGTPPETSGNRRPYSTRT
ncbi:hypothetical protein SCHPADRAFT_890872 [Schizopora paradoxa]|uniref:Uncharacterized protein n=1 Tax=Schizopora paradoxa TaxID=27342 RepID=A0A0H2RJX2_9AGAM|nr:hypothetical protein SCHPADRAFT_890872 [Schizopora paradoxa]